MWLNVAGESGARTGTSGHRSDGSASISTASPMPSSAWPMVPSALTTGSPRRRAPRTWTYQSMARRASDTVMYGVSAGARAGSRSAVSGLWLDGLL